MSAKSQLGYDYASLLSLVTSPHCHLPAIPKHTLPQAELDAMKALVAQLQASQGAMTAGSGNSPDAERMIAELQAKLAEKQSDLANSLGGTFSVLMVVAPPCKSPTQWAPVI